MTHSESDLELLETHLDGALDAEEASNLQSRLATDNELSAALVLLRSQRAVRLSAFESMQPDADTAERLVWRVRGAMRNQQKTAQSSGWGQWRIARLGSAAAACMVLGFFAGRMGHGGKVIHDTAPSAIVSSGGGASLADARHDEPSAGQFTPVSHSPQISVPVTNEYGQVVAWQTFDNSDQAKSFTEDLHRARGEAVAPAPAGQTKMVDFQEQVPF